MNYKCLLFPILVASATAQAAPVYLNCKVLEEHRQDRFQAKVDEGSGQISHSSEDGSAFNTAGFFTTDNVKYKRTEFLLSGLAVLTTVYEIDRNNLRVVKTQTVGPAKESDSTPPKTIIHEGTCAITKAKSKKF